MKLCKNCEYFKGDFGFLFGRLFGTYYRFAKCTKTGKNEIDPVNGKAADPDYNFCGIERIRFQGCGPEGKNFKPRY